MVKKRTDISLDDLDPFDLDATPENIALVEKHLAKIDKKRLVWSSILAGWKEQIGEIAPKTPASGRLVIRQPRGVPKPKVTTPVKPLKVIQGSIADAVWNVLSNSQRPITFQELENELVKCGLGDKMTKDHQPHRGALQRLREKGYCVKHNGRYATPGNLKKFLEEVATGRAEDVSTPIIRNKWAVGILKVLEGHPEGLSTVQIIDHMLNTMPEFVEATGNLSTSYIFGVVDKLYHRDKLIVRSHKVGRAWFYRLAKYGNDAADVADDDTAYEATSAVNGSKPSDATAH
jgi:hypothetical protein